MKYRKDYITCNNFVRLSSRESFIIGYFLMWEVSRTLSFNVTRRGNLKRRVIAIWKNPKWKYKE